MRIFWDKDSDCTPQTNVEETRDGVSVFTTVEQVLRRLQGKKPDRIEPHSSRVSNKAWAVTLEWVVEDYQERRRLFNKLVRSAFGPLSYSLRAELVDGA